MVSYYQLMIVLWLELFDAPSMVVSSCELFAICRSDMLLVTPSTVTFHCELLMDLIPSEFFRGVSQSVLPVFLASNFLRGAIFKFSIYLVCLLYTSDAADE